MSNELLNALSCEPVNFFLLLLLCNLYVVCWLDFGDFAHLETGETLRQRVGLGVRLSGSSGVLSSRTSGCFLLLPSVCYNVNRIIVNENLKVLLRYVNVDCRGMKTCKVVL